VSVEESAEGLDGRVLALSDGVFAIAATLLALDLRVPDDLDSQALHDALRGLMPSLGGYAIAFLVIGLLWLSHHELFGTLRRISPQIAAANIVLLGLVALLPFPSSMLADYGDESSVVIIYAANVAAIALVQVAIVAVALRTRSLRGSGPAAFAPSAVTAAIFVLSMPVALVSPTWTPACWILLIPAHATLDRIERHRHV
jgi:TMEM175 potassium channel family protein